MESASGRGRSRIVQLKEIKRSTTKKSPLVRFSIPLVSTGQWQNDNVATLRNGAGGARMRGGEQDRGRKRKEREKEREGAPARHLTQEPSQKNTAQQAA